MFRAFILAEMRARGIRGLGLAAMNTVADLKIGFPDQCGWVARFTTPKAKLGSFVKALAYEGPIEMLTCDMCILGSKTSLAWSVEEIERASGKIARTRREWNRSADEQAHPCKVLVAAMT